MLRSPAERSLVTQNREDVAVEDVAEQELLQAAAARRAQHDLGAVMFLGGLHHGPGHAALAFEHGEAAAERRRRFHLRVNRIAELCNRMPIRL